MNPPDRRLLEPRLAQPVDAPGMGLLRTQRPDIEALRRQRRIERRIVDLGIMGERDEGGIGVEPDTRQGIIGPFIEQRHVGEALRRGEGGARIDDRAIEPGELRHRRERLADMHRADDDDAHRRHLHRQEMLRPVDLDDTGFPLAQSRPQNLRRRIGIDLAFPHQPLRPVLQPRHQHRRPPRRTLFVQQGKMINLHAGLGVMGCGVGTMKAAISLPSGEGQRVG